MQVETKILRSLALKSMGLMLTVFFISVLITRYNGVTIYANDSEPAKMVSNVDNNLLEEHNNEYYIPEQFTSYREQDSTIFLQQENMEDILGNKYLKIKKPENNTLTVSLEDLYLMQSIIVKIEGLHNKDLSIESLSVVNKNNPEYDKIIKNMELSYISNDNNTYAALYQITLDTVYVHNVYEDNSYIYIDLVDPHKVYDRIIVVDAGHGGTDVGTFSPDMKYLEKDINLSIVLHLKELLDQEDIKVYYTRTTDRKVYLNPRVDLANNVRADFFISIHCNSNVDPRPNGTSVLYGNSKKNSSINSKELSENFLNEITKNAGTKNMGTILGENIYIINKAKVPVSLIEVAFISNENDLIYLSKDENRKDIAKSIYTTIMETYKK